MAKREIFGELIEGVEAMKKHREARSENRMKVEIVHCPT